MIRIVVVDDHPVVRAGLRAILDKEDGFQVVAEGGTGADALRLVTELRPQVLVLDINLPDFNGLQVVQRIRQAGHSVAILVLTALRDRQLMLALLESGAQGFVLKDEVSEVLSHAVRAVAGGENWLSPVAASEVVRRLKAAEVLPAAGEERPPPLTPRETEVLHLLAQGLDNAAIADRLVITKRTVQNHISAIYGKLGVTSRTEAMRLALQHGWVTLGEE